MIRITSAASRCLNFIYIGLGNDEIAAIRGGQAVVETLRSRTQGAATVFVENTGV